MYHFLLNGFGFVWSAFLVISHFPFDYVLFGGWLNEADKNGHLKGTLLFYYSVLFVQVV